MVNMDNLYTKEEEEEYSTKFIVYDLQHYLLKIDYNPKFALKNSLLYMSEYATLSALNIVDNTFVNYETKTTAKRKYALKSENEELKIKIDKTSSSLNTYAQDHQELAILVGEHVIFIIELNYKIDNLKRKNINLKTTIEAS